MNGVQRTRPALGLVAVVGLAAAGGWIVRGWAERRSGDPETQWEIPLQAIGAASSGRFAMATGPVDNDVEGVFLLDFQTGLLQCAVLSGRTSKFGAVFQRNILQDLPGPPRRRTPQYLLTTGQASFPRAGRMVARSVAYVLDATTGNFAAYAMQWRPDLAATGRGQAGEFVLLDTGTLGGAAAPAEGSPAEPQR